VKETKDIKHRLQVQALDGKIAGTIQLNAELFNGKINKVLLYEANKMYEAAGRRGSASTKTRANVSGGGIKPWRQKGTGRARVGSIRSPLWRHGGIIFGPHPRDYGYTIPKKMVRGALLSALNARLSEERIKPIVKLELKEAKTKVFKAFLAGLKLEAGKTLVVVDSPSENVKLSARNLAGVTLKNAASVNARDILLNDNLVIEKEALEKLAERVQ
jgi:large subunit ribosomal protein L4